MRSSMGAEGIIYVSKEIFLKKGPTGELLRCTFGEQKTEYFFFFFVKGGKVRDRRRESFGEGRNA